MRVDMGIGADLRDARLRAGLSAKQLADRTKLKLEKIEALEKSDFKRLPRGIYLDGVVKAYAREVGVDAKLAVERLREEIAAAEEAARLSAESAAWISEKKGATKHTSPPIAPPAVWSARPAVEIGARPPAVVPAPQPGPSARRGSGTRLMAFAVLVLLAAVGSGMYLLSATRTIAVTRSDDDVAGAVQSAAPDTQAAVRSRVASLAPDVPARAVDRDARGAIAPAAPVARPAPGEPPPAARVTPDLSGEPLAPTPVSSTDISGTWDLTTQVEAANAASDRGVRLGYTIDFRQNGDQIRGSGYKSIENGEAVAAAARTPITLQGTIEGRELVLTFTEQGPLGANNGRFVLRLGADLALRGSFQSTAAKSRGSINGRRRP